MDYISLVHSRDRDRHERFLRQRDLHVRVVATIIKRLTVTS
jgi:hypothetical protein